MIDDSTQGIAETPVKSVESSPSDVQSQPVRALTPIRVTLLAAILIGGGYAAYQRTGTTANASLIVYVPKLAGGFVAIGKSDDRPGFLLLSRLDQEEVTINVAFYANTVTGNFSSVHVESPIMRWDHRLRGPQLVLIDESGTVTASDVNWTLADLNVIENATDCESGTSKRCGAPFADIADFFAKPNASPPMPAALGDFLKKYRTSMNGDSRDSRQAHSGHDHHDRE